MSFLAGDRLAAGDLNDLVTTVAMASSQTVNNSTTLVSASGLAFNLAASTTYLIDGYLRYTSNPTADIKFGWTLPTSATGWWSLLGPVVSTAPIGGAERQNYTDFSSITLASALPSGGDDTSTGVIDISAVPRGHIVTSFDGILQLQFAQNTANGSNTILGIGSWLRVSKLS